MRVRTSIRRFRGGAYDERHTTLNRSLVLSSSEGADESRAIAAQEPGTRLLGVYEMLRSRWLGMRERHNPHLAPGRAVWSRLAGVVGGAPTADQRGWFV